MDTVQYHYMTDTNQTVLYAEPHVRNLFTISQLLTMILIMVLHLSIGKSIGETI